MVSNNERDGQMRVDRNGESDANYFANSFDDIYLDDSYKEKKMQLDSNIANWFNCNGK